MSKYPGEEFPYSEAELVKRLGYTRQRLTQIRLGLRRERYPKGPQLKDGVDWKNYGRAVMYARHTYLWLNEVRKKVPCDGTRSDRLEWWRTRKDVLNDIEKFD